MQQVLTMQGDTVPQGWGGSIYTSQDSASTVIDWYETQITDWTKVYENSENSGGYTAYSTKGSDALLVMACPAEMYEMGSGTAIVVVSGPTSGLESLIDAEVSTGEWDNITPEASENEQPETENTESETVFYMGPIDTSSISSVESSLTLVASDAQNDYADPGGGGPPEGVHSFSSIDIDKINP